MNTRLHQVLFQSQPALGIIVHGNFRISIASFILEWSSQLFVDCHEKQTSKLEREAVPNDDILQYPFGEGWLDQHTPGLIVIAVFELCL